MPVLIEHAVEQPSPRAEATLAEQPFISLTSFRKDGRPVSTPVWCTAEDGTLLVITEADSGKVKRIRRDPHVRVAPCTARGKPRGPAVDGEAEIEDDTGQVERLLARKYGLTWRGYKALTPVVRRVRRQAPPRGVTLRITLGPADHPGVAVTPAAGGLRRLVGSGERIGLLALPFAVVGLTLNVVNPSWFAVGGPSDTLRAVSIAVLIPGIAIWAWSVALILRKVPRHELITSGPFAVVKHPLYTDVALLVLPWAGFLLDSWLGAALGAVVYLGSRRFAPAEEARLAAEFGPAWEAYARGVWLPWI